MKNKISRLFGIVDTKDNSFYAARSGKVGWPSAGAAKNAWHQSSMDEEWGLPKKERSYFDNQDRFVIVEIDLSLQLAFHNDLTGYNVQFPTPDTRFTDEYNKENRVIVTRNKAPFNGLSGACVWSGETFKEALDSAREDVASYLDKHS